MEFLPFPARLRAEYNDIVEYGEARVAGDEDAVDFTSDFVPLVPLGTGAGIEWLLGKTVVKAYTGHTYLSSAQLLRLTGVDPEAVRDTRSLFATNISMPATLALLDARGRPTAPAAVKVVYLSQRSLTLQVPLPVEPGGRLLLDAEVAFLTLRGLALQVRTRVTLLKSQSLLLCDIPPMGDENMIALSAYAARLETLEGR